MKSLKASCIAAILALAFSIPASAGEVETPGVTAPPPPPISTGDSSSRVLASSEDLSASGFEEIWMALISLF